MSDTITAQQLIDLMARVPVEARPEWWQQNLYIEHDDNRVFSSDDYGCNHDFSVTEAIQSCIGSLVQWLDAWCDANCCTRESAGPSYYKTQKYSECVIRPPLHSKENFKLIAVGRGPSRLHSLVALVEQLAKQEATN